MSWWKKLFGSKPKPESVQSSSFAAYKKELEQLGLRTFSDLQQLVEPLVKPATHIEVQPASRPEEGSNLQSHFGGKPYFEKGETWPSTKAGQPLDFIFQVFNESAIELPDEIELVQFFYSWEDDAWDTADDGWKVTVRTRLARENVVEIARPAELPKSKFCKIKFRPTKSLPDWEGIEIFENNASMLSCVLNEDEPWSSYYKMIAKLIGEPAFQSQLGGYPKWIQGEATPRKPDGKPMQLLFQIDSEDHAGIMWGDAGLIYVFYDAQQDKIEFSLQCY